jgi:heat shock protein HslJ
MSNEAYAYEAEPEAKQKSRRLIWIGAGVVAAILIACACVICLVAAYLVISNTGGAATPSAPPPVSIDQIVNIQWQWAELVESQPASQTVVPDAERYVVVFRPDGQLPVKADCNLVLGLRDAAGHMVLRNGGPAEAGPGTPAATATPTGEPVADPTPTGEPAPEPTPPAGELPQPVIIAPPEASTGEEVTFDGSQSQPGSSPIAGYGWDFGDGSGAEGATVTHAYGQPGTYLVTLTVRDEAGVGNFATTQIAIREAGAPTPEPTSEPEGGLVGPIWKWTELNQNTRSVVPDPERYTLRFHGDGSLDFVADCGSGSGTYAVEGDGLRIDLGTASPVECGPDSLSKQYLELLSDVVTYELDGDRLNLYLEGGGGHMAFVP